jgi:hypothetical protein
VLMEYIYCYTDDNDGKKSEWEERDKWRKWMWLQDLLHCPMGRFQSRASYEMAYQVSRLNQKAWCMPQVTRWAFGRALYYV